MATTKQKRWNLQAKLDDFLIHPGGTVLLAGIGATTAVVTGGTALLVLVGGLTMASTLMRSKQDVASIMIRQNQNNLLPPDHPVSKMTAKLAKEAGLKNPPKCIILIDPYHNADSAPFIGTAGNSKSSVIAMTPGTEHKMTRRELEAVMAHEIAHLKNNDSQMSIMHQNIGQMPILSTLFVGMTAILSLMGPGPALGLGALAVAMTGTAVSAMIQAGISRARERRADRGSIELTKNPWALASALGRIIEMHLGRLKTMNRKEPGATQKFLIRLFRSHPKTKERRQYLMEIGKEMIAQDPKYKDLKVTTAFEADYFEIQRRRRIERAQEFINSFKDHNNDGHDNDNFRKLVSDPLANPLSGKRLPFNKAAAEQDNNPPREKPAKHAANGTSPKRFDIS